MVILELDSPLHSDPIPLSPRDSARKAEKHLVEVIDTFISNNPDDIDGFKAAINVVSTDIGLIRLHSNFDKLMEATAACLYTTFSAEPELQESRLHLITLFMGRLGLTIEERKSFALAGFSILVDRNFAAAKNLAKKLEGAKRLREQFKLEVAETNEIVLQQLEAFFARMGDIDTDLVFKRAFEISDLEFKKRLTRGLLRSVASLPYQLLQARFEQLYSSKEDDSDDVYKPSDILNTPDGLKEVRNAISTTLHEYNLDKAVYILDLFSSDAASEIIIVTPAISSQAEYAIENSWRKQTMRSTPIDTIVEKFGISLQNFKTEPKKSIAEVSILRQLSEYEQISVPKINEIVYLADIKPEKIKEVSLLAFSRLFGGLGGNSSMFARIDTIFIFDPDLATKSIQELQLNTFWVSLAELFELETAKQLVDFLRSHQDLLKYFESTSPTKMVLTKDDAVALKQLWKERGSLLTLTEAELIKIKLQSSFGNFLGALTNGKKLGDQDPFKQLYEELINCQNGDSIEYRQTAQQLQSEEDHRPRRMKVALSEWTDETEALGQLIRNAFTQAADLFGYKNMFKYITKEKITKHDALQKITSILQVFQIAHKKYGLSSAEFYNTIMLQVWMDDAIYSDMSSHLYFNELCQSFPKNIEDVIENARQYQGIVRMKELVTLYADSPRRIFSSWFEFRRFCQLAREVESAGALQRLRDEPNQRLRGFVETITFDPQSRVDFTAALQLIDNPDSLLRNPASHVSPAISAERSVSKLTSRPHLDLLPRELVLALVEGTIDRIQEVQPLKIEYRNCLFINEQPIVSVRELILFCVGERSKSIKGNSFNPSEVLKTLQSLFLKNEITLGEYLGIGQLRTEREVEVCKIVEALKQQIIDICLPSLFQPGAKTQPFRISYESFVVQVHRKSDPEAMILGNRTASCDNFPDGKRLFYQFNPFTNNFSIAQRNEEKKPESVGQSLIVESVEEFSTNKGSRLLAADNFELPAKLREREGHHALIRYFLAHFFQTYYRQFPEEDGMPEHLPIGANYTFLKGLKSIQLTSVPIIPLLYTDKKGPDCLAVDLTNALDIFLGEITVSVPVREQSQTPAFRSDNPALSALTYRDLPEVAEIERTLYRETPLFQGVDQMAQTVIAKDIANERFSRPNLSLIYTSEASTTGYLIAYEGKFAYNFDELRRDEPIIYIMDLAVLTDGEGTRDPKQGIGLMYGFAEQYAAHYGKEDRPLLPIFAEFRRSTSYRFIKDEVESDGNRKCLITRALERLTNRAFEVKVLQDEGPGENDRVFAVIRPKESSLPLMPRSVD